MNFKLGTWITDNFSGINEGIEKGSATCIVTNKRDRERGARGAVPCAGECHFPVDHRPAQNAARGPRPQSWWKQKRKNENNNSEK